VREVRLIDENGVQVGIISTRDALDMARDRDLDLVEVAPNANPPVCKIMDFGKFKYEQDLRRKESRRKTTNVVIKEMKFRPKIDEHDYTTKTKHVERFLVEGSKVKITIMFRGRETQHPELGRKILDQVADRVVHFARVEAMPKLDGRNMVMVLAPDKKAKAAWEAQKKAEADGSAGSPNGAPPEEAAPDDNS